ncbi:KN motif and ankyrin repeat domain-containing protein 4 [Oryzias melastigma]|uniref:KN motif and ankyrin repeat domain-containing protein 4 n=1 Tax=Oryzias melastigma TaxID=30732 RepID=A0A834FHX4_ORYME|nr:KN motif and ankyrin repeat domain-containing protein 4 [Oryzias melastigma]
MMDKTGANGIQTSAKEGGVQRKQLPYSVETPYGFHLDLDFLKYVDDIEKGNTIKRVHIHRRIKGPAKFSTLPRNFSLPGHGVRPTLKEKDSAWPGTSTLGPKPKSRVTEVQQIFDFRGGEGGTSSFRGPTSQGTGFVSGKPREEMGAGTQGVEDNTVSQSRPNLLRASSMPITLQQRKGSDSSSPDCTTGTPENGSTENMFRPSPDITERRCLPQDRAGLHQQITVALKRVRELEEQVKTIPELKAQICSLREEREKLLNQLKVQTQMPVSASSSAAAKSQDAATAIHVKGPSVDKDLSLLTQDSGGSEVAKTVFEEKVTEQDDVATAKELSQETARAQRLTEPSEKLDKQKETFEHAEQKLPQGIQGQMMKSSEVNIKENETRNTKESNTAKEIRVEDWDGAQTLQEKLMTLEAKLTQASQELERTNNLLKQQIQENKAKEERILQLSEGMRVEICTTQAHEQTRRRSIDMGTVTERIDCTNQETETELPSTIDQGTDTDRISVEVCVPKPRTGSIDQGMVTTKVDTHDQTTEMEAEIMSVIPPRPRANSMERGTITESIITQDQMTETPVAERVNQVTETEGETVTDHPQRPRASSVNQGTETERVGTVDRVTETEIAQRADQQTETQTERRLDNNPARSAEAQSEDGGAVDSERPEDKRTNQATAVESKSVVAEVTVESSIAESTLVQTAVIEAFSRTEETPSPSPVSTTASTLAEVSPVHDDSIAKQSSQITDKEEPVKIVDVSPSAKNKVKTEDVSAPSDSSVVTAVVPVRPQRGRKPSTEQAHPSIQSQAGSMGSQTESNKAQAQQIQTKTQPQVRAVVQEKTQSPMTSSGPPKKDQVPSVSQVEAQSPTVKLSEESKVKLPKAQSKTDAQKSSSGPSEVQARPKSIQTQSQSQASASRRDSKEMKAPQKGVSQPSSRSSVDTKTHPTRRVSDAQSQGTRRSSSESQPPHKGVGETQSLRRSSNEAAPRRGSSEAQALRRESGDAQAARRGSSDSPTSPAALGQVVTRLTGLLGEQWAQLGSSSGTQQMASQQEVPVAQKQTVGKKVEAGKGTAAKPAGKSAPAATAAAATTGKPAGKPGPSKMSSIQSQLVSSLSVLSAFYSPSQKGAAASKQQEQGLKSIMKKNGAADKQGNKGAKKNLKFVGVNGGYETTSSEESSGDEKSKVEVEKGEEEEEDSLELKVEKEKEPEEAVEVQEGDAEVPTEKGDEPADQKEVERGLMDPEGGHELLEEEEGEKVDKGFIDACVYVKDRMEEVSSPDKEMRQVLVVLYQEWFKVSSQKDSQADTVRLYLRQVGLTTPTLLPYVVNLTDGNGNMALHYSVSHSNFSVVKLLLDTGLCEIDNVNKAGYTPVMLAALTAAESPDDLEVAHQLLRLGDVNARSRQAGQTALMLAVRHGRVAMVKLLLSCGADVNAQDREGSTALMCASEHGHTHIVRLLLETGRCDASLTDKNGRTALSAAEEASHQDIAELLKSGPSEPASGASLL